MSSPPTSRRLEVARAFIKTSQIEAVVKSHGDAVGLTAATPVFESAKDQAMVVGSDVVSFVTGVTAERREAIVHSSLLAQLVAKQRVKDTTKVMEWYEQYFDVLANVGWVIQQRTFADYEEKSHELDAHKAILAVAGVLLGPAAGALSIVTATINALHEMDKTTPWIRLWNRETHFAKTARFQIGLVQQSSDGELMLHLMAFVLEAKTSLTQVLFFKSKKSEARLRHASGRVTLDTAVVDGVREELKTKLIAHAREYVLALPELPKNGAAGGAKPASERNS